MGYGNGGGGGNGTPSAPATDLFYYYGKTGTRNLIPIDTKRKSITYNETTPDLLLDLDATSSATVSRTAQIRAVNVRNDGYIPAIVSFVYNSYTAEGTIDANGSPRYLKYLLNPNEEIVLPTTRAVMGDDAGEFDGTPITSTAPNSNNYADSGANLAAHVDSPDTTITVDDGGYFRVGDLIQLGDDSSTATKLEIMEVTAIATHVLTVTRGLYGSNINDKDAQTDGTDGSVSGANVYLPFVNAYHDFDKYTVVQSDAFGKYKANNFFGYGRAASGQAGIVAGSVAIQFYSQGYQGWGMSGVASNSESGLASSTEYGFDITVDGAGLLTSDYMKFTTDGSNTKFGGSTGIIAKMQTALDTYFYTDGSAILNEKVTVSLENGDVVFRSGSFLSTSAILLAAPSAGETTPFGVGRIPAIGDIAGAVASRLDADQEFNPITNNSFYKQIFIRDDGNGNLVWENDRIVGSVNYESGAIDWTIPERPNAEFVVSVLHTSPFSGKLDGTTTGRLNSLRQILGNTPQQKCEAILTITTF